MKSIVMNVLAGALMVVTFTACGGGSGSSGSGKSNKIKMTAESESQYFYLAGSGVATIDWGDNSEKVSLTLQEYGDGVLFRHTYPNQSIRTITINGDNITKFVLHNSATNLDVSRCSELKILEVGWVELSSLDVSKNTELTVLICSGKFESLNVSKNTALSQLHVHGNLTSLDLSKNTALTALDVSSCKLSATALNTLFGTLHSNTVQPAQSIYSLNTNKNKTLRVLNASYNQLKTATLNAVSGTLHNNTVLLAQGPSSFDVAKIIKIGRNPGEADCDRSIAERKGWTVRDY